MNRLRKAVLAAVVLAIAALLAWAFVPRPLPVETFAVSRGLLRTTVEEEGHTRIRERYVVTAPVAGYAQRLELHAGDAVSVGQRLLQLEPLRAAALDARSRAEAQARVAQAEAGVRAARMEATAAASVATLARSEAERLQPLVAQGAVSRAEQERAQSERRRAEATLASARSAVEMARYQLSAAQTALRYAGGAAAGERIAIVAPVAGSVLQVMHEDEGVVAAGQPLLAIGDPAALEVEVDVLSADAVHIQTGTQVELEGWGGGQLLAHVRSVEPVAFTRVSALGVEERRVHVIADIDSPPAQWRGLGDGFRVDARFVLSANPQALRVPHSALFRSGADWTLYAVENGRLRLHTVTVGARGNLYAEITSGLAEGTQVVSYPDDRLRDGLRVSVRETETAR